MSAEKSVKEMLREEVESRLEEMESPEYKYVAKLNKADYIGMAATAAACVILLIIGII